ncbi:unnamed protein product [Sphagnum troendelagicum]|uniref:BRISC and BRCA1-A complex member 1 n=1 Tax=Sphagnum troendelagicum TaxID=128251 RepID=A0ABP0U6H7_9BRYO
MKAGGGVKGLSRLDAVKQALVLFVHSKLLMHPQHRFSVATLSNNAVWHQQEFTNDMEVIGQAVRSLASGGAFTCCDLSELFQIAAAEAHSSHALDRTLRVVLIYCRSSVVPEVEVQLPGKQRLFTFDALYLHDKPTRDNCPQCVYDVLVDALERVSEFEGYIFESSSGSACVLFRHMCLLLSHPQQRCPQDEFDAPKDLAKMVAPVPRTSSSGGLPQLRKEGEDDGSGPRTF